jgi:outer membrane receptor protein involved in Fe transport
LSRESRALHPCYRLHSYAFQLKTFPAQAPIFWIGEIDSAVLTAQSIRVKPRSAIADEAPADGDIVVTATRENTLLSKKPIAITAIAGDGLRDAGITNPTQLEESIPNLSIVRANGWLARDSY